MTQYDDYLLGSLRLNLKNDFRWKQRLLYVGDFN